LAAQTRSKVAPQIGGAAVLSGNHVARFFAEGTYCAGLKPEGAARHWADGGRTWTARVLVALTNPQELATMTAHRIPFHRPRRTTS